MLPCPLLADNKTATGGSQRDVYIELLNSSLTNLITFISPLKMTIVLREINNLVKCRQT